MRTASRLLVLVAGLTVPVLATACVPADALRPKIPSTLDGALAEVAHPALDWASGFFSGAGVITPAIIPGRCTFDAASQYFVCTPLTARTLTLNQRFTLLDASGARQSAFDSATTAGLHLENAVTGEWEDTTAIDGQQALDLTGLGTSRHTLNGSSLTLSTPRGADGLISEERKTTIVDLVLPAKVPGAPGGWPLSGTVDTRSRSISASGDTSVFIATIRFDGTDLVKLTMTVPGGIRTCRVNLAAMPPGQLGCTLANE